MIKKNIKNLKIIIPSFVVFTIVMLVLYYECSLTHFSHLLFDTSYNNDFFINFIRAFLSKYFPHPENDAMHINRFLKAYLQLMDERIAICHELDKIYKEMLSADGLELSKIETKYIDQLSELKEFDKRFDKAEKELIKLITEDTYSKRVKVFVENLSKKNK
jgi:hypothetical protein